MKPYITLAFYKPEKYRGSIIGPALCKITKEYGLIPLKNDKIQRNARPIWKDYKLHAELRRSAVAGSQAEGWHRDGDTTVPDSMDFAMVLWCQKDPTLLKDNNNVIWQPKPFEVILFRNMAVTHKRPENAAKHRRRWSFRQRVQLPTHIELP